MARIALFIVLFMKSICLFASRGYVTDVYGGQVFSDTNGIIETVTVANGVLPFVSPSYVSVNPNGRQAIVNDYGQGSAFIYYIDTMTNTAFAVGNNSGVPFTGTFCSAFSPTQQKAYVGTGGVIWIIDTATMTATGTVSVAGGIPPLGTAFSIAFSNDGTFAYVTQFNQGVYIIDTATDTVNSLVGTAGSVPAFQSAESVAMNPSNSNQAYVGDNAVQAVYIIDTSLQQAIGTISSANGVPSIISAYDIAYSPDGKIAYICDNAQATVFVVDTTTNVAIQTVTAGNGVPGFSTPLGVAFSPNGTFAWVTDVDESGFFYVDTAASVATQLISPPNEISSQGVAFIPAPLSPYNLRNKQKKNDFGLTYTIYNLLKWDPSPSLVVLYNIYRNGVFLTSVTGLSYTNKDVPKGKMVYQVKPFDIFGEEGSPAILLVK